LKFQIKGIL